MVAIAIITLLIITTYKNIKPTVTDNEIRIEAVLEDNNTGVNSYDEYILNINMYISKDSHITVYPYIKGLSNISFSEKDVNDSYIPGAVGSDFTERIAISELRRESLIENSNDISLTGFGIPDKAGEYKSRIYFDKLENFKEVQNPVLVCVYSEKRYGKDLTWTKIAPITVR